MLEFTIPGAPRTKKNHGERLRIGKLIKNVPSPQYRAWDKTAQLWLAKVRSAARIPLPINIPVNCEAHFYRDALTGDAVGYYQGLADALQEAGIVVDDKLIVQWDGSRLLKAREDPRIYVIISPAANGAA